MPGKPQVITFWDGRTRIVGTVSHITPKAVHLDGRHGPVLVPAAWVRSINHPTEPLKRES